MEVGALLPWGPPGRLIWPCSPALHLLLYHLLPTRAGTECTSVPVHTVDLEHFQHNHSVPSIIVHFINIRKLSQPGVNSLWLSDIWLRIWNNNSITTLSLILLQPCFLAKIKLCQSRASAASSAKQEISYSLLFVWDTTLNTAKLHNTKNIISRACVY